MSSNIEISISKTKIVGLLIGAIAFLVLGVLFVNNPLGFISPIVKSPKIIKFTGIAAICFFGFCLIFIVPKLFDNKPGLVISDLGIICNTNNINAGLIEWDDITRLERKQVMSTSFLILYINDPEKYIKRAKSLISKKAMSMNYKAYGSPVSINSNSLKIDIDNLETLIKYELQKRK